jgi:hypothetical protein
MSDKLKKISDKKYTGPKKTFTEKLTKNEIKNLLDGYTETPFDKLHIGHNVRYFVNNVKSGNLDFRMGGFIIKIEEDFVIISNGTVNWSAQKKNTIYWEQIPLSIMKKMIEEECQEKIKKKEEEILHLHSLVKQLKNKNSENKKIIKDLLNNN